MNYLQAYNDYSTFELLKIAKRPGNHPPEGVSAATEILKTRSVTLEDLQELNQYFRDQDNAAKANKDSPYGLKTTPTNFGSMVLDEAAEPPKWLNILILLMALHYAWTLYITAKQLIFYLECDDCSEIVLRYVTFLPLLYIPLAFYLLFRRSSWGWIILFADNLFKLISGLFASYSLYSDKSMYRGSIDDFYLLLALKAVFILLLWRNSVAAYYNVDAATKRRTLIGTVIGTFLFSVLIVVLAVALNS
ncbi:MAG TPA: hypothetical protein VGB46_07675 [Flavisolibacter sp.]